jgi:hypothetical protein
MKKEQRDSERADLDLFVRQYFSQKPKDIEHRDKPDLIINLDEKVIGIEHTRIYRTSGATSGLEPHAQIAVQHRIVDSAWKEFSSISSSKLWLLVSFEDVTTYKMRESRDVGRLLAQVVNETVAQISHQPGTIVWHTLEAWQFQTRGLNFPHGIKQIDFQIVDDKPKLELWGPAYSYMVPHLSVERIQERISEKEKRIQDYLLSCDEVWLLIVIDTGVPSNHFEADQELMETFFHTSFTKVILLRSFHTELFELKTLAKKT